MRDGNGRGRLPKHILLLTLLLAGCANEGDLGRDPKPTFVYSTIEDAGHRVRHWIGRDELPELPFTAAEDALREAVRDISSLDRKDPLYRGRHGDGFSLVEAAAIDLRVERERFQFFVRAAQKTMEIDDARERRLNGIDAFEQRRRYEIVRQRRRENTELIHSGLRLMRRLLSDEHARLQELSVDYPDVPLQDAESAYETCMDDVISFHAMVDRHDHERLGGRKSRSYKG